MAKFILLIAVLMHAFPFAHANTETRLSAFYRIHNSYLINLKHITRYVKDDGGYIVMNDQSTITISRRRKEGFMKLFSG